ncbi:MAG: DUF3179 domain-containing protein [Nitriliruptorales bacterium]|nr:DUF3179 domain-containing protein [Nitriliruptorales bacterium]
MRDRTLVGLLLVGALIAAGCSAAEPDATGGGDSGSVASSAPPGILGLPLDAAIENFLDDPFEVAAALLADRFRETGDQGYVPYAVDLLRISSSSDLALRASLALEELTGVPHTGEQREDYVTYGTWLDENAVQPADGYLEWKRRLYADIDERFGDLLAQVQDPLLAARLQWGGVVVAGIPELNDPAALPASEAEFMTPDETVFGAQIGQAARAYPLRILGHHELANDHLAGVPVAMTFCTLCRSALLFDRRVGGRTLTFKTSGLLLRSNKVMLDVETGTLWEQLTGKGLAGELADHELERYLVTTTSWQEWRSQHPDTDVLDIPEPALPDDDRPYYGGYSYQPGDAYSSYYASEDLWFPGLDTPDDLPPKAEVLTIERDGDVLAVHVDALDSEGPVVLDLADGWVVAVPTPGGGRIYDGAGARPALDDVTGDSLEVTERELVLPDGRSLTRAEHGQAFWFAWVARHPDSRVWPATGG